MEITGEMISTGFRKGLDSKWGSLASSTVTPLPDWCWYKFMDDMREHFADRPWTEKGLKDFMTKVDFNPRTMDQLNQFEQEPILTQNSIMIFSITMNLISDEDVRGLVNWVSYCNGMEEIGT